MSVQTTSKSSLYKHDCNDCIYLGSDEIRDYYFCNKLSKKVGGWTSLIIRNSDNPSDYFSMPLNLAEELLTKSMLDKDSIFAICYKMYFKSNIKIKLQSKISN